MATLAEQQLIRNKNLKREKASLLNQETTKFGYHVPKSRAFIVSLSEKPIGLSDFKNNDPDIRATRGEYFIKYMSKADRFRSGDKAYAITQDLVHMPIHVSGPRHWHAVCDRIPECKWLERNSTLTDAMFAIAKMHPGLSFLFTIKYVEYSDKIMKQAKEQGIDIDNKPFMFYVCSKEVFKDKFSSLEFMQRDQGDYRNQLAEAYNRAKNLGEGLDND